MEENNKEVIEVTADDVVEPNTRVKIKNGIKKHKIETFISNFSFLFIIILYIVLSLTVKGPIGPYNLNGWAFWWILFLAIPTIVQIYLVIKTRRIGLLPIWDIVLVSYLLIGLLAKGWHPYWALIFVIPAFHILVPLFRRKI